MNMVEKRILLNKDFKIKNKYIIIYKCFKYQISLYRSENNSK